MSALVSLLGFFVLLGILVIAHELGHFLTARFFRIPVDEFGIGFPPRAKVLATRNGVAYTLNWLPIGGFVKFSSNSGDNASYGIGSLREAPIYQRILILAAGPIMNIAVAAILYTGIALSVGIPVYDNGLVVNQVFPDSPAARAGLLTDDIVLQIGESGVISRDVKIGPVAETNVGTAIPMIILRKGTEQTLTITPGPWSYQESSSTAGFGFGYTSNSHIEDATLTTAVVHGAKTTYLVAISMVDGLFTWLKSLLGLSPKIDNASMTGIVGMARGTGEIIERDGWIGYFNWMAIISLNLAVFNLLPIPALDGSHILFAIIEFVRRKRIPLEYEARVHFAGFALLMLLMVVVTVSDVQGWISGTSIFGK
jgi:regulator of sigma E protease